MRYSALILSACAILQLAAIAIAQQPATSLTTTVKKLKANRFPLKLATGGRHLLDANDQPFLIRGRFRPKFGVGCYRGDVVVA